MASVDDLTNVGAAKMDLQDIVQGALYRKLLTFAKRNDDGSLDLIDMTGYHPIAEIRENTEDENPLVEDFASFEAAGDEVSGRITLSIAAEDTDKLVRQQTFWSLMLVSDDEPDDAYALAIGNALSIPNPTRRE